jgi:AcrR family transcriptional regulator
VAPKRLSRQARRDQLVAAAMPLLARQGPMELSLDGVARRAGVTRNLLYHYFPGGRVDLVAAAVEQAERALLGQGETGPQPLGPESIEEHVSRIFDHALAPTHAWRIHRLARGAGQPEVSQIVERSTRQVADALAALTSPGSEPSPPALLALHGYVPFAETVLDGARASGVSREATRRVLAHVLAAVTSTE